MIYAIYIRNHDISGNDFELEIEAYNRLEAIEIFYRYLNGEFDRDFISSHMLDN